MSKKQILILSVMTAILALGGIAYGSFYLWQSKNKKVACTMEAKLCPDGSSVGRSGANCEFAACPASETANWQTYRNEEYGFEVKYPNNWMVDNKNNFRIYNLEVDRKAKTASQKIATEPIAFSNGIYLNIYDKDKTLEEFIQTKFNNDPTGDKYPEPGASRLTSMQKKKFTDDITATYVTCDTAIDPCNYILLDSDNYIFQFSNYCAGNSFKSDTLEECNDIFSTFKFIN